MDRKIDPATWPRKEIFDFFSGVSNPFYSVTFRQDVTKLYEYVKREDISFYHAMTYLVTKAINEVEAFHYVIRGREVFRIEDRIPSFTDLKKGSENFYIVTMPIEGTIDAFSRAARSRSQNQQCFIEAEKETDQLIYISCLPWVDLTSVTSERDLAGPTAKDESIPHITWGKYVKNGDKVELGLAVEVNHRLIDGVHIGMFAEKLTRLINEL